MSGPGGRSRGQAAVKSSGKSKQLSSGVWRFFLGFRRCWLRNPHTSALELWTSRDFEFTHAPQWPGVCLGVLFDIIISGVRKAGLHTHLYIFFSLPAPIARSARPSSRPELLQSFLASFGTERNLFHINSACVLDTFLPPPRSHPTFQPSLPSHVANILTHRSHRILLKSQP